MPRVSSYESLIIFRPTVTDDEVAQTVEVLRLLIEKHGGEMLRTDNWGQRKLAYDIKKEKRGQYLLLQFKAAVAVVQELTRSIRVNEHILRTMTVSLEGAPQASRKEG